MNKSIYKGFLLTLGIGLFAYLTAPFIQGVNSIILSFFIAVAIGNIWKAPNTYAQGIKFSSSKVLEWSIIALAFSINLSKLQKIGSSTFLILVLMIVLVLLFTLLMARYFPGEKKTNWLIGFGTAICGSSAIAALAPSINASGKDTGISIAVVNILGSIAMIAMPLILIALGVPDQVASLFIGGSLHAVGNVAGAGFAISEAVGATALTLKLARVSLLSPALIFFAILSQEKKSNVHWSSHFKLPTYIWLFIGISLFVSFVDMPDQLLSFMRVLAKVLLSVAMAGIGLNVNIRNLVTSGKRALIFGLLIFVVQLIIFLVAIFFL